MKSLITTLCVFVTVMLISGCGRGSHVSMPASINIDQSNETGSYSKSQSPTSDLSQPVHFRLAYTVKGTYPGVVSTGDFNADGNPDFVYGEVGSIGFCFGNGRGEFDETTSVLFDNSGDGIGFPNCSKSGDFNNDGRTDFAVAFPMCTADNRSDDYPLSIDKYNLYVFWGGPNVSLNPTKIRTLRCINDFTFTRLNSDKLMDLMVVGDFGSSMVHYQTPTGEFIDGQRAFEPYVVTKSPDFLNVVAGDLSKEGKSTYVITNAMDNLISYHYIYYETETSFDSPLGFNSRLNSKPQGLSLLDVNGDGVQDLIAGFSNSTGISISFGNIKQIGTKYFWQPSEFKTVQLIGSEHNPLGNVLQACSADFDRDGKNEIAVADLNNLTILKFTDRSINAEVIGQITYPKSFDFGVGMISTADFNLDGRADLVTSDIIGGRVLCYFNVAN